MTKGWKIGLSIVGVLGFCLLSGVIGIGYWLKTNGKQFLEQQMNNARTHISEGEKFGASTDQQGCVKEALAKLDKLSSTDIAGLMSVRFFSEGCLRASQPTPNFCDGVPAESEIMASARWRVEKCQALKSQHTQCSNVVAAIQRFCTGKTKTSPTQTTIEDQTPPPPPPKPSN